MVRVGGCRLVAKASTTGSCDGIGTQEFRVVPGKDAQPCASTSMTTEGSCWPLDVRRSTSTRKDPGAEAVTVSGWVAGGVVAQPDEGLCALPTANVPEDGDTTTPPGPGAICQPTEAARSPAAARPSSTLAGCPTVTEAEPLGSENPMAGMSPVANDGGLSEGDDAQSGSGLLERT